MAYLLIFILYLTDYTSQVLVNNVDLASLDKHATIEAQNDEQCYQSTISFHEGVENVSNIQCIELP